MHSPIVVALLAPVYAFMVFGYPDASESIDYTSLTSMVEAFGAPSVVVAGWIHYLVFDLFIGAWESRDAMRRGVPHLLVIPCLILTLLLGPLGLLAYVVVRFATTRAARFDEFAGMEGATR